MWFRAIAYTTTLIDLLSSYLQHAVIFNAVTASWHTMPRAALISTIFLLTNILNYGTQCACLQLIAAWGMSACWAFVLFQSSRIEISR
jgi:hypothetical protein